MRTETIGSLQVTVVGLGCNNFGRELDAEASRTVIHAALNEGITFFDTADMYGRPRTSGETILGEVLKPHRDDVIIATKFGRKLDDEHYGAKPVYVKAATVASLRRLQTDHIDLMQVHVPDPTTPIEETLGALGELVAEGKIREIGGSKYGVAELRDMLDGARAKGVPGFASTQAEYSLLMRNAADVLGECERVGVTFLPYRPLSNGLLTGKYRLNEPFPLGTRIGDMSEADQAKIISARSMAVVEKLAAYGRKRGYSLLELAFRWLLSQVAVPSVIAGARTPSQVASNAAAADGKLTSAEMADIEQLLNEPA